jgi:hypothetical protein
MLKKELVTKAQELGIKGYSRMNKQELMDAIAKLTVQDEPVVITVKEIPESDFQTLEEIEAEEKAEAQLTQEQSEILFDLKKYANFTLYSNLRVTAPTSAQFRLVQALERNFKVKIDTTGCNRGMLSDKIQNVYKAIMKGTVKPRPQVEVKTALEHVEHKPAVKPATPAQIAKINELEKETGIVNTTVIRDTKIASEIITRYISVQKCQTAQEIAMTTIEHPEVKHSLINTIKSYIKGLFA